MMTEKDMRILEKNCSKKVIYTTKIVPPIMSLVYLIAAGINLHLAKALAEKNGMNLKELFVLWTEGFSHEQTYIGLHVLAIERLWISLSLFVLIGVFLFIWIWKMKEIGRLQRILHHIKQTECDRDRTPHH